MIDALAREYGWSVNDIDQVSFPYVRKLIARINTHSLQSQLLQSVYAQLPRPTWQINPDKGKVWSFRENIERQLKRSESYSDPASRVKTVTRINNIARAVPWIKPPSEKTIEQLLN